MRKQITLIILIITSFILNAQDIKQKDDNIFQKLIASKWIGKGKLMGKKALFTMKWEKTLDDKFIKLEFSNNRTSNANNAFKAIAFYKLVIS